MNSNETLLRLRVSGPVAVKSINPDVLANLLRVGMVWINNGMVCVRS